MVAAMRLQRCGCSDAVAAMRLQDSKSSRFATPGGAFSTELCCACAALVHAPLLPHFYRPLPAGCITDAFIHKHRRVSSDASPSSSHFASCTQCVQTPSECARRSLTGRSLDDPIQLRYDIWLQQLEAEARGGHSKFAFWVCERGGVSNSSLETYGLHLTSEKLRPIFGRSSKPVHGLIGAPKPAWPCQICWGSTK